MSPAATLERVGPWLVAAYAGTALALPEAGEGFKVLVLVAGFGGFFWLARGRRFGTPLKLLLAAALVALLSWGLARLHHPQWAESSAKVHRLTHWFSFLAVAWLLAGRVRAVLLAWGASLAGLLVAPWFTGQGWRDWFLGWHGERVDFGLHNAQHATLLFATGLLGLTALAGRCLAPGPWRLLRAVLWALAILTCAIAVVITQTRGVWLGLAVAALVMLAAAWLVLRRRLSPGPRRRWLTGAMLAGVLGLVLMAAFSPIVEQRLADEHQAITRLARGQFDGVTGSGAGRLVSWRAALPWIAERPLLGWGGNGRSLVLTHSPGLPGWIGEQGFRHLHNGYLDTLVNYGLAGLAVLAGLLVWLTREALRARRAGALPADFLLFYLAFLGFWLVVNLFESFLYFSSGDWAFTLVAGGVATFMPWRAAAAGSDTLPAATGAHPAHAACPGRRRESETRTGR